MGCDIHLFVEAQNDEGKWYSLDVWKQEEDCPCLQVGYHDRWYTDRDYQLFTILAGVRNYDNSKTIRKPRGIAFDLSTPVGNLIIYEAGDGHSHSHFTLLELEAYDQDGNGLIQDHFQDFYKKVMVRLGELNDNHSKLRIVFFFDS